MGAAYGVATPLSAAKIDDSVQRHVGKSVNRIPESGIVRLKMPAIAESPLQVPVSLVSRVSPDQVDSAYIFVDNNPTPFVVKATFTPKSGKVFVATRIKVMKSTKVRAVIKLKNGKVYQNTRFIKVTAAGC